MQERGYADSRLRFEIHDVQIYTRVSQVCPYYQSEALRAEVQQRNLEGRKSIIDGEVTATAKD